MMLPVLIKWPSRARPHLFLERLPLWMADDSVRFLITLDRDDVKLDEYLSGLAAFGTERIKVRIGDSGGKVEAINDGVAEEDFPTLILASDDFVPQRPDYAKRICELLHRSFPDGDGVLHTNDGINGMRLNSLPIMGRRYFDHFGWIYNPQYVSLWCDVEMMDVSRMLGLESYCPEVICLHQWIGTTPDDLCRRNESFYEQDCATYQARKAAGFPR